MKEENKEEEDKKEEEEREEKRREERRIDLRRNRGSWLASPEVHRLEIRSEDETEAFCSETSP